MSEEQKEKWYKSFTKEQLIERCEYLQRSCERKEDTITDREMENADLENEIERLNNIINELEKEVDRLLERQYKTERFARENGFSTYLPAKENLLCVKDKIKELKGSDKE